MSVISLNMVGVAQLVEHQTVALNVAGSIPVAHPIKDNQNTSSIKFEISVP